MPTSPAKVAMAREFSNEKLQFIQKRTQFFSNLASEEVASLSRPYLPKSSLRNGGHILRRCTRLQMVQQSRDFLRSQRLIVTGKLFLQIGKHVILKDVNEPRSDRFKNQRLVPHMSCQKLALNPG